MVNPTTETNPLYQRQGHLYTLTTPLSTIDPLSSLPPETRSLFKPPPLTPEKSTLEPYVVTVPSTIFHAQGGGQPSDVGTMHLASSPPGSGGGEEQESTFTVHQVRKLAPSTILHMGTFRPPSASFPAARIGAPLVLRVDIPVRVLHSRLHTAGHVIGLAVHMLKQSPLSPEKIPAELTDGKASHYPGAAFVEFVGLIPGDAKAAIQRKVDELVSQDLNVLIHFWGADEAARRCISGTEGAAVGEGDEVRVVDIGGLGSYPCGGTHVATLAELGRVVVRNIKRQKGITKVSYEVADAQQ